MTIYTSPKIGLSTGITVGPDGALWFANVGNVARHSKGKNGSIGRMTVPR